MGEKSRGWFVAGLLLAIGGVVFFSLRPIFIKLAYAYVTDPVTRVTSIRRPPTS